MNLFTYGVFKKESTLKNVIKRPDAELSYHIASVPGYRLVYTDSDRAPISWWIAFAEPDAHAAGMLVEGLIDKDFIELDRFEGTGVGWYERGGVTAQDVLDPDTKWKAQMYVAGHFAQRVIEEEGL